jgi:hypothetical protein
MARSTRAAGRRSMSRATSKRSQWASRVSWPSLRRRLPCGLLFRPCGWFRVGWRSPFSWDSLRRGLKRLQSGMQADLLAAAAVMGWFPWILWSSGSGWWDHKAPMLLIRRTGLRGNARETDRRGIPAHRSPRATPGWHRLSWRLPPPTCHRIFSSPWFGQRWEWRCLRLAAPRGLHRCVGKESCSPARRSSKCLAFDVFDNHLGGIAAPTGYPAPFSVVHSALFEVLVLAAVGYWLFERTLNRERCGQAEHVAGTLTDGLGTLAIALWFAYRFPSDWVPVPNGAIWVTSIWAAMATVLMGAAWLMRRRAFVVWAVALAVAAVMRGVFLDLGASTPEGFWNGSLFHVALAAGVMLAALPFAFKLRKPELWAGDWIEPVREVAVIIRRPEQWFFSLRLA